jgi:hypothetical protein
MDIFKRERHLDLSEKRTLEERIATMNDKLKAAQEFIEGYKAEREEMKAAKMDDVLAEVEHKARLFTVP